MLLHLGAAIICPFDTDLILHIFQGTEMECVPSQIPISLLGHMTSSRSKKKCVNMMSDMEQSQSNTYLRFQTITSLA